MKIVLNILKAFLINITFIGIIFASNSCPSINPQDAKDLPVEQAEADLGDILCSFIDLHTEGNNNFYSALSLTKKKIIPYIDFEYSTELALGKYWEQLQPMDRKIFERDIKTTLIEEYINTLVNLEDWNHVNITVDNNFYQLNNLAEIKVISTLNNNNTSATVANGELHVAVGLALLYPTEFVIVNVSQWTGGSNAVDIL